MEDKLPRMTSTSALSLRIDVSVDGMNGVIDILQSMLIGSSKVDVNELESVKQGLKLVSERMRYVKTLLKSIKKLDEQREYLASKVIPHEGKSEVVE